MDGFFMSRLGTEMLISHFLEMTRVRILFFYHRTFSKFTDVSQVVSNDRGIVGCKICMSTVM